MGALTLLLICAIGILSYVIWYNGRENRIAADYNSEQIVKAIKNVGSAFRGDSEHV